MNTIDIVMAILIIIFVGIPLAAILWAYAIMLIQEIMKRRWK